MEKFIINRTKKYFRIFIKLLPSLLMYPILPLLGWGPLTHAYLNDKIFKQLQDMPVPDDSITKKILGIKSAKDYFVLTAGYPDIIKAKGFLKGDASYDYAHNPIPNRYYGQHLFARNLFEYAIKSDDMEIANLALSWKSHQICDVFAHHVPFNQFWGYANRETFFGVFWDEVIKHFGEENVGELPGAFYRADHWMCELVIDLFCCLEMGMEWGHTALRNAPNRPLSIMPDISRAFIEKHGDEFRHEYRRIEPIEYEQVLRGKNFSDILNTATMRYCESLIEKRSAETLMKMINNHAKFDGLKNMLEKIASVTAKALINPMDSWTAPKLNTDKLISKDSTYDDVFLGDITPDDYRDYYSEHIERECQKYTPKRDGIVKLVFEYVPLSPMGWFVKHTPLVSGGNIINRSLLPKSNNSYSLSLRFAYNLRERDEEDFMSILRRSLEEANVIGKSSK